MTVRSSAPRFEHHSEGRLGIGEAEPRLSWTVAEAPLGYRQEAAEHLRAVENEINHRPRAVLDDHTPAELFTTLLASPNRSPLRR